MSINPMYIVAPSLQSVFISKDSGAPLSGGQVFFYQDTNRTNPKPVYTLQNNAGNYTYTPLANPLILSSVGTPVDANGQDIVIYWYPFDDEGNLDLYYVVVQDYAGVPQFVRQAWPNPNADENEITPTTVNYIPNGQFLLHTNLMDNELVAGTNTIAQGGFQIILDSGATSVNTLSWIQEPYTENPNQSPRYVANFACTMANPLEVLKNFRVFFYDVNKFSAPPQDWAFAFWSKGTAVVPYTLKVYKNFGSGGSSPVFIPVEASTIGTAGTMQTFIINFESNAGYNLGSGNNDFIAIDIQIPTDLTFNVQLSDFVLLIGDSVITGFPIQTNADMITRGVMGWADLPNPNGAQLNLPPVLTNYGMAWDVSDIGDVFQSLGPVPSPTGATAISNKMPLDGSSYINTNYSYYGIPFSRLGTYMMNSSPLTNIPLFGTGTNYATGYTFAGVNSLLRLTVNSAGTSSAAASDGDTGWTIGSVVTYGGSATGSASIGYTASNTVANTIVAIGNFATANSAAGAGTSGFTITTLNTGTGYFAQQNIYSFTALCVAASALANPSGNGLYFYFSNSTTDYYMWFQITNETDPTVGSRTGIQVNLNANATAQDVANMVREAMSALQSSTVNVSTVPTAGQYWLFSANPSSAINYYVWYTVNGAGTDPAPAGRIGIKVALVSSDTEASTVTKTQLAINSYQYAVPNLQGMYLRGYDPNGIWDTDVAYRLSNVSGLSGANLGTFEYPQFESHTHGYTNSNVTTLVGEYSSSASKLATGANLGYSGTNIANTGGDETRTVNTFVTYYTRY